MDSNQSTEHPKDTMAIVLYADGSAQPNPGYGGWGIHGYTVDMQKPVKLSVSQKKNIVTEEGYLHLAQLDGLSGYRKLDKIDCYGASKLPAPVSNNYMELIALENAFGLILDKKYQKATILTDNMNAISAMDKWYHTWSKNGWKNSSGKSITLKDDIERIYHKYQKVKLHCPDISLRYVKGHSGNLGNDEADKLAKKGSTMHKYGKNGEIYDISREKKPAPVYHDMFTKNRWYFMGGDKHHGNHLKIDGKYAYLVGTLGHQKKDEDFGMKTPDGVSGIILLPEREPVLSRIEDLYRMHCKHEYDFVVCGRLDTAFTPANYHDILSGNLEVVLKDPVAKTLSLPNGKIICMEYNPAYLSYIQMARYQLLLDIINDDIKQAKHLRYTDLRDVLIQKDLSGKKGNGEVKYRLNETIQRASYFKTNLNYGDDEVTGQKLATLTLGIDLPDKVHLGKLIKLHGEDIDIQMITQMESSTVFSHYCRIRIGDAVGYWTNFQSSTVFV